MEYYSKYLNLKNKMATFADTPPPPPPLVRNPPTRDGIITSCVRSSINYKNIQIPNIIQDYFDLCNQKLIENHFELVTFKEFNNIRNDIINNN